jgi:hypothetical protein
MDQGVSFTGIQALDYIKGEQCVVSLVVVACTEVKGIIVEAVPKC